MQVTRGMKALLFFFFFFFFAFPSSLLLIITFVDSIFYCCLRGFLMTIPAPESIARSFLYQRTYHID